MMLMISSESRTAAVADWTMLMISSESRTAAAAGDWMMLMISSESRTAAAADWMRTTMTARLTTSNSDGSCREVRAQLVSVITQL